MEYGKMQVLGSGAVLGAMFTVNLIERTARKLHRTILLHFGLVTFNFHFPETQNLLMFVISRPTGHDHGPPSQLF